MACAWIPVFDHLFEHAIELCRLGERIGPVRRRVRAFGCSLDQSRVRYRACSNACHPQELPIFEETLVGAFARASCPTREGMTRYLCAATQATHDSIT